MYEKLQQILAEVLETDRCHIRTEKRLVQDYGADLFVLYRIMMRLESAFGIMMQEEQIQNWHTVSDIWDDIRERHGEENETGDH